jgi:hypothetical protein
VLLSVCRALCNFEADGVTRTGVLKRIVNSRKCAEEQVGAHPRLVKRRRRALSQRIAQSTHDVAAWHKHDVQRSDALLHLPHFSWQPHEPLDGPCTRHAVCIAAQKAGKVVAKPVEVISEVRWCRYVRVCYI